MSVLEELRDALKDQYLVESELGRGGMATVFLAEDLKHGRRVAIKVLSPELSSSLDGDRFKSEIQIAARLSHPHILPLFDSGEANGLKYYTMPLVEGESLRGRLKRETQLSIEDAIAITCEVADALSYAHAFGVVHRDIKPENILLHGGHAVVADFGIARVIQDAGGTKLTQTGLSVGTALYMSPEQFGGGSLDGRSDMYSLACVLYEMLVGEVPFTGPSAVAIMARHTMEAPPSIQIVRSTVPDELENTIMRALEKVPADRFMTVAQFKEALLGQGATSSYVRRTRAQTRAHTAAYGIPGGPARRWTRQRVLLLTSVTAIVVAASGFAVKYVFGSSTRSTNAGDIDLRRIAVRYFSDESRDSSLIHVADGLTESLIRQLQEVRGLDVISAAGVAPYRSPDVADDSVGRVLKAGVLVRGTISPEGNYLRVAVQLVDGQTGDPLKRDTFKVPKGQFLSARDSLAQAVSVALRDRLGEEVRLREQQSATRSVDAWSVLRQTERAKKEAEALITAGDPDGALKRLANADSLASQATVLDARWPEPLIERGSIVYRKARMSRDPKQTMVLIDSGVVFADRALALDPRNADALELRGTLRYYRILRGLVPDPNESKQALDRAESDLREAVNIAPRQASAWNTLSALMYEGRTNPVESHLYAQKAFEADEFVRNLPEILWRLYATSYDLEQFPDAIKWCDQGRQRFPANRLFVRCHLYLLLSKAVEADPAEAWRLRDELERLTPKQEWDLQGRLAQILVAITLGRANLADSAHRVLERARGGPDIDPRGELIGYEALARTFFGEHDQAITLLERYLTSHPEHRAGFTKVNTWWWRDLQQDPRFKTLAGTGR